METVEQLVSFHHIQVQLSGGAPWGFTLKGGLEHGEPLIITKIEDGGKAAVCAKLKVGDELININGSTLYGSRQEALILIKGSFRILKLTVRRRSVPAIRPHSWHLPKPSEPPLPPPPPSPPPPRIPSADSPPLPPPPPPSAMQLHPGPYSLPWHTSDNSDFLQWGQLSRPYSSTDRSSSLGSMESLDTPTPTTQPYSDSCNSPTDPAAFANKRDSAYSSFSASSNTSDYAAVPLRPDEACSMDNLLQSLGPSCQGFPGPSALGSPSTLQAQLLAQKSRSLTRPRPRPVEVKERPSSCCYDNEQRGGGVELLRNGESGAERKRNAPQPPTRKDSFRATQSRPGAAADKRCGESSGVSSYEDGNKPPGNAECGIPNGFPAPGDSDRTPKAPDSLQTHTDHTPDNSPDTGAVPVHLPDPETASPAHLASGPPGILPPQPPLGLQGQQLDLRRSKSKQTSVALHRHSAPEKLLATQLQLLQLASEPCSQADMSQGRDQGPPPRDASRSSTPGSVFLGGEEDASSQQTAAPSVNGGCRHPPLEQQHAWGRSVSVPGDAGDTAAQGGPGSEAIAEGGFEPLSTAASMDTLLEQKGGQGKREPGEGGAKRSSRSHLRNRRRSERFATNLRNEIQRKKAQLQRSRGPGGLLCSGETVQEEEGAEAKEEEAHPDPESQPAEQWNARVPLASAAPPGEASSVSVQTAAYPGNAGRSRSVQVLDTGLPSFGVGIRVVEEPAPAGKARRWRWTPEHKLQPEPGLEPPYGLPPEAVLGVPGSQHGVCAFTAPFYGRSASCHRVEESSILPFADRMKFFEESSRGESAHPRQTKGQIQAQIQAGEPGQQLGQRRYSFQGGAPQEGPFLQSPVEGRRLSVCTGRERQEDAEREHAREREERLRERERQEMEAENERARLRQMQMEREREEEARRWEEEREREMERAREAERVRWEIERETKREWKKQRDEEAQLGLARDFYGDPGAPERIFQSRDALHTLQHHPRALHQDQSQGRAAGSAFHPVTVALRPPEGPHSPPQGYTGRSHLPAETNAYPQRERSGLNRKYSLTERDCSGWRRDLRPPEGAKQHQWGPRPQDGYSNDRNGYASAPPPAPLWLRGRAMSENDLRFDGSHRWSPSIGASTLSEAEEGAGSARAGEAPGGAPSNRKKTPPPPRPPPPKWEQFHRRRASHHALFWSSVPAPPSVPHSSSYLPPPEASRQRSYSLPPERQEVSQGCPRCTCSCAQAQGHTLTLPSNQSPPQMQEPPLARAPSGQRQPQLQEAFGLFSASPTFSRRAFKPVAPPTAEREPIGRPEGAEPLPGDMSRSSTSPHQDSVQRGQPPLGAQRDRTPSPRAPSHRPATENGPAGSSSAPQDRRQPALPEPGTESETPLSPSPAPSLDADLDIPVETDIDDFQDDNGLPAEERALNSELPCFALPVTVLETDIDTLAEGESSPALAGSGWLEEEPEGRDSVSLSLDELFPHSQHGESGTDSLDRRSGASSSCSYYSTSTAKAQLLTQLKDCAQDREDDDELTYKKQLMESLRKKLGVLREAQRGLQDDVRANAQLGEEVESKVVAACKPNEVDKFRMFIGDLDKVVSLMLSLSGRLLRVETTLDTLDPDTELQERLPLLEKKRQLTRQLSEAQDLKEHVDRREQAVSRVLARCLSPEQHRDYSHFVKMKATLLVEQRQLEDKIRLGEEQLRGLRESLGLGLGLGLGLSLGYGLY